METIQEGYVHLYCHLPPISKIIQKDDQDMLVTDGLLHKGTPIFAVQQELSYIGSVVIYKAFLLRCSTGQCERGTQ